MDPIIVREHPKYMQLGYFTLGNLIEYLEAIDRECVTKLRIVNPHSWRGSYSELAFEVLDEYSDVGHWLDIVKPCLGKVFEGYKGGDFEMKEYTDVHLAMEGSGGGQQIGELLMDFIVGKR